MPKTPNPYSKLGHTLNTHINAIRAINHHSIRQTAHIIKKSVHYTQQRVHGQQEWTIGDIEKYAAHTGYQPEELLTQNFQLKPSIDYIKAKETA